MFKVGDIVDLVPYSFVQDGIVSDIGICEESWTRTFNNNPHIVYRIIEDTMLELQDSIFTWSAEDFELHVKYEPADIEALI